MGNHSDYFCHSCNKYFDWRNDGQAPDGSCVDCFYEKEKKKTKEMKVEEPLASEGGRYVELD